MPVPSEELRVVVAQDRYCRAARLAYANTLLPKTRRQFHAEYWSESSNLIVPPSIREASYNRRSPFNLLRMFHHSAPKIFEWRTITFASPVPPGRSCTSAAASRTLASI